MYNIGKDKTVLFCTLFVLFLGFSNINKSIMEIVFFTAFSRLLKVLVIIMVKF